MKIALYGGTFDPIHHGHLILAREAMEQFDLDQVVFIPAAISPHKLEAAPTPAAIRWEMVTASIAGEIGFAADDLELHRAGPSYTFDTVAEYRRRFPEAELFYCIGLDNLEKFATWHRAEELQAMVTLIVMDRDESDTAHSYLSVRRRFDLSASEVRNRVANGRSIRYLVTTAVDDLIRQHHLYQNPSY